MINLILSEYIKMFTKLILQLKSDRISYTVLMIQFSPDWDGNRTPIDFETIFLFDFCVHIIRFCRKHIARKYRWKIVSCDCTTVPQLLLQQPAILNNHWTSSLIKRAYYSYSFCQKKKIRGLKKVAN